MQKRLPLWQQITNDLHKRLAAGDFGDDFPGEVALAEHYGVSRGTIRKVLRPLRESGVISAGRGRKPSIVATGESSSFGGIYSLHEVVHATGATQRSEVLAQRIEIHEPVAELLAMPADTAFFYLERRRWADDQVFAWDRLWLPADQVKEIHDADFSNTAVYKELSQRCGLTMSRGQEQVWATTADADLGEKLLAAEGSVVFHMQRVACVDEQPFEVRETVVLADQFSIMRHFGMAQSQQERLLGCTDVSLPVQL